MWIRWCQKVLKFKWTIIRYRSPFSIFQLPNDLIAVVGARRFYGLLAYGRKVEVGNEPGRFLRVCAEKDVSDTDIPMIDTKVTECPKTLERCECLVKCEGNCSHTFCGALSCTQ